MDTNVITHLISEIGFPAVVCLLCFFYIYKTQTQWIEEIKKLGGILDKNTQVIEKLIDKMDDFRRTKEDA